MIYVSSSCVKRDKITDSIEDLVKEGFRNIELSGGTRYYDSLENDLLAIQERHGLNLLCHNYFPPPQQDFVVNLASLNEETYHLSMAHLRNALRLSRKIGAGKFAFHAGFLFDIPIGQIGGNITHTGLFDPSLAWRKFLNGYSILCEEFQDIDIYVENNVLNRKNYTNFKNRNPFFFTDSSDLNSLEQVVGFKPLVDVAHLKVSSETLGLDLEIELGKLLSQTDYIHISDNNGQADTNGPLLKGSSLWHLLKGRDLSGKTITLEVYSGISDIHHSFEALKELLRK